MAPLKERGEEQSIKIKVTRGQPENPLRQAVHTEKGHAHHGGSARDTPSTRKGTAKDTGTFTGGEGSQKVLRIPKGQHTGTLRTPTGRGGERSRGHSPAGERSRGHSQTLFSRKRSRVHSPALAKHPADHPPRQTKDGWHES